VTLARPGELDELPEGTTIEILDKRGTELVKQGGDWWSTSKTATQNTYAYVNTRRYGATVRGTEQ
jgi:hypothetical protein